MLDETGQLAATTRSGRDALLFLTAAAGVVWAAPLLPRAWAAPLLVGVLAVDLLVFADGFHPLRPRETTFPPLAAIEPIRQDRALFRVAGWGQTLVPNSAVVYGVQDFRGYDGLGVRRYAELLDTGFRFNGAFHELVNFEAPQLLDLLNIKYLLVPRELPVPADGFTLVRDDSTRVYRNDRVLPRAFLADTFVVLQGNDARWALRDGTIDVRRTLVLEHPPTFAPDAARGEALGTAEVAAYTDHGVVVRTQAEGARLLMLTDTHYPGWTATLDGAEAPILRANFTFRAVSVPAGAHVIEFRYRPRSFQLGLAGSVLGLALAAFLRCWRRKHSGLRRWPAIPGRRGGR